MCGGIANITVAPTLALTVDDTVEDGVGGIQTNNPKWARKLGCESDDYERQRRKSCEHIQIVHTTSSHELLSSNTLRMLV